MIKSAVNRSDPDFLPPEVNERTSTLAIASYLFLLLFTLYLLTYTGFLRHSDEMSVFAVTENIVKHGQFDIDQIRPGNERIGVDGRWYCKYGIGVSLLSVPLYLAAIAIDRVGLVQTVMLLNPIVTALTGTILFLFSMKLGYRRATGIILTIAFSLGTIAWVYTKSHFSEPTTGLCLLGAIYVLLCYRDEGRALQALVAGSLLGLAMAAKLSNAVNVPIFAAYAFIPVIRRKGQDTMKYLHIAMFSLPIIITICGIGFYNYARFGNALTTCYEAGPSAWSTPLLVGLHGLLLSSGKSIFLYSPILLLLIPSIPLSFKRHPTETFLILLLFATNCALFARWHDWHGYVIVWGPRFLVPMTPFLIIILAPLFKFLLRRPLLVPWIGCALLGLLSVAVQVSGLSVPWGQYYGGLRQLFPEEAITDLILYRFRYSPILLNLPLLRDAQNLDFAWIRMRGTHAIVDVPALVACVVVAILLVCALVYLIRLQVGQNVSNILVICGLVLCTGLCWFLLRRYYGDPRFGGGDDYHALLEYLRTVPHSGEDALVLNNKLYQYFFLNYNKTQLSGYTLRKGKTLKPRTIERLERIVDQNPRVWLSIDSIPVLGLPRPVEHWLTARAYKVKDLSFSEYARLCLYVTSDLPDPETPQHELNVNVGNTIKLIGYDLYWHRDDPTLTPDDMIKVSLLWQVSAIPQDNYTVFVQLLDQNDHLWWQTDRYPVDGFRPTSSWQIGEKIRDNYVVMLPSELPPGRYRLITGMYLLQTGERLILTTQESTTLGDHIQLTEIQVASEGL